MNLSVLVKQTVTTEARIRLGPDGRVDTSGIKQIVNPYDEFAVEEALRIQEARGGTVRVFCVGPQSATEALRHCLAMGADEAVRIEPPGALGDDAAAVARLLATALARWPFDLVLAGRVAIDSGAGQVPGRIAELLDLPILNVVSRLEVGDGLITAHREADGATEVLRCALPAMVTAEKGLNEPRYPKLPNVLKAKSKPIHVLTAADLGVDLGKASVEVIAIELPPPRQGAVMLKGTVEEMCGELVRRLREEAKVL